ncbi:AAA family ATPase [Stenotrophomonas sp.]|uniref:AAA family ATPase n=1 Tax=Stenotrophomonas sp. TaxID=69392 RepID=UPI0028A2C392|nr:AAA family ATPase [Stenotrophomonas sp.]
MHQPFSAKREALEHHRELLGKLEAAGPNPPGVSARAWQGSAEHERRQIQELEASLALLDLVDSDAELSAAIRFAPSAGDFIDPENVVPSQRRVLAEGLKSDEAYQWNQSTVPYLTEVQSRWFELTHPKSTASPEEVELALRSYRALDGSVKEFFGVGLERDSEGCVTLFGRRVALAELSSGQKVVLQLIAALHAKNGLLGSSILIMDEPETHLHPHALVHLLKSIERFAPDVQIWIATHSVPLLSYINATHMNSIWAVSEGMAEFSGKRPELVINQLLGDDESLSHLVSFISLPYHLASNNYSYQCLLPPSAVMTASDDPQLQQIRQALDVLRGADGGLRVLDYGAGKGRLVEALGAKDGADAHAFDYVAYDFSSEDRVICEDAISGVYGSSVSRYFNDVEELIEGKGESWADCVVMTNVFHEIPVADWVAVFSERGLLARMLRDDGYLLIVEDQQIPVGEMAHQHGFLLMNTNELRRFFNVSVAEANAGVPLSYKCQDGRLTAHLVPRSLFSRVDSQSRRSAIEAIRGLSISRISGLRQGEKSYRNGLLHGLWTQQLANSILALESC